MITFVIQWWRNGKWVDFGEATNEGDAYEICADMQGYWRILHYPNGVDALPVQLFDELQLEINGRTWRAGEYEAWQRVKRGAS